MGLPSPAPDRTAVVTGASSGIGAEIARQLARRGHGVTLVARRGDRLAGLAEELAATGVRAEVMAADLSDRTARAGLLDRVDAAGLAPYVLVNNAGLSTVGPVAASDPDAELNLVETGFGEVAGLSDEEQATLPKLMWVTAEAVAKAGVDGMARGRRVVIPGRANQLVSALARATPKTVLVPIVARAHPGLRDGRSPTS